MTDRNRRTSQNRPTRQSRKQRRSKLGRSVLSMFSGPLSRRSKSTERRQARFVEPLEDRRLLSVTTAYVANAADFTDTAHPGNPQPGDAVTWNGGGQFTTPHAATFGTDAFTSIADAVANVSSGGTIDVAPGTYDEHDIALNQPITIDGPNVGVNPNNNPSTRTSEATVDAQNTGNVFSIAADDVTINGFTIQNAANAGILMSSAHSGAQILDNIITNNSMGIYAGSNGPSLIQANLITANNKGGPAGGTAIYSDAGINGLTINNNVIDDQTVNSAITIAAVSAGQNKNVTISNNVVDINAGANSAIYLDALDGAVISSNDITTHHAGGAAIKLAEGDNDVSISNNTIHDNVYGIWVVQNSDFLPAVASKNVTINYNSITGSTTAALNVDGAANVYTGTLDASKNWWGDISGPTIGSNIGGLGQTIVDPNGQVTYRPWLIDGTDANAAAPGFQLPATITVMAPGDVSPAVNDYTTLANAIASAVTGQKIVLSGTFDWTQTNSKAAWAKGVNGIDDTTPGHAYNDDYAIIVPGGVNNVTLTAASLGGATIQGPGDLPNVDLEGVLDFYNPQSPDYSTIAPNTGWTISNLQIYDFDSSLYFYSASPGAFDNTTITNNHIRVAADVGGAADPSQNIGIDYSEGTDQTISNNVVDLSGDGANTQGSVGMQSSNSGVNYYDGLKITGNTINVLHAQSAAPVRIIGIWENAGDNASNITVSGNTFQNLDAGNDPALNNQIAFRLTSASSATTSVVYSGNTVKGAHVGFQYYPGYDNSGTQPVQFIGNTLTNVFNGFDFDNGAKSVDYLSGNTITGTGTAGVGIGVGAGSVLTTDGLSGTNAISGFATGVNLDGGTGTLTQNTITGNITGVSVGSGGTLVSASRNFITGNTGDGISIDAAATSVGGIHDNDLSGNGGLAVDNLSSTTVDASGNWWGNVTGPTVSTNPNGTGAKVSAKVDYTPWLNSGTDTNLATAGFQGDFSSLTVSATSPQAGVVGRIQEAINLATADGTVYLNNGLYLESNISVNKAVTIQGQTRTGVIVAPNVADVHANNALTDATNAFVIHSSNVKIETLTIDGNGNTAGGLAGTNNYREAVVTDNTAGDFGDITVNDVTIQNIYRRGVDLVSTGHAGGNQITNSSFNSVGLAVLGDAVALLNEDATITGNTMTNVGLGVGTNYNPTPNLAPLVTIQGNTISGATYSLGLSGLADGSLIGGPTAADGNTINVSPTQSVLVPNQNIGIVVQYAAGQVTVQNNTINVPGANTGILLYHDADPTKPVLVLDNTLTATGSTSPGPSLGAGIFMLDSGAPFGETADSSGYATIQGNTITDFVYGVQIYRSGIQGGSHTLDATIGGSGVGQGNTITGGGTGLGGAGIQVFDDTTTTGIAQATIVNNTISGNATGIDLPGGTVTLDGDVISSNTTGISINGNNAVAATLNDETLYSNGTGLVAAHLTTLNLTNLTLTNNSAGGTISNVTTVNDTPLTGSAGATDTITGSSIQRNGDNPLGYSGVTNLNVTGSNGSDTFTVTPATSTTITIDGGLPTPPASPGDTLNLSSYAGATLTDTFNSATGNHGTWTVAGHQAVNFSDIETLGGTPTTDLQITKSDNSPSSGHAVGGSNLTYTIVVTNAGPSAVNGASIVDSFPASFTNASYTATATNGATGFSGGGGGSVSSTMIDDTAVSMPAGSTITYTVTGTVDPAATGLLTNTATVTAPGGVTDTNLANNSATDTDTLSKSTDLSITKTDNSGGSVLPGASLQYTIVVRNNGPNFATGATVTDMFPSGFSGSFTATATGGATGFTHSGSGNINDTVNLPNGSTITYVVTGTVSASATSLSNTATVTPPADIADTNAGNNSATVNDTVTQQVDVSVTKTDGVTSVNAGTTTTYTIVVSNAGPSTATNVAVSDPLPAGVSSATWSGNSTSGTGALNNTIASLAAGASVTYTMTVQIDPAATGSLANAVTVTAANDSNPANNTITDTDTIAQKVNLSITKSDNKGGSSVTNTPGSVVAGAAMTYVVVVSNSGPSNLTGATVTDAFPADFTVTSSTPSFIGGASITNAGTGGNLNDTVSLPAGGAIIYVITGTVSTSASGSLSNTATVTLPAGATNTGNLTATDTDNITTSHPPASYGYLAGVPGDHTPQTFVQNLYRELLGREPHAGDVAFWTAQLQQNNTAAGRQAVVAAFMNSQEYKDHYITTLYEVFLGRAPEAGALQFWTAKMGNPGSAGEHSGGADEQAILAAIVGSDEFYARAGGTDQSFAQALYQDLLGRPGEPAGISFWSGLAHAQPQNRDGIVRAFLSTPEAEHKLLDSFYPAPGGTAANPLPAPGTGVPAGTYDLAFVTGLGWENLYLEGPFNNSPQGNDAFFNDLAHGAAWDDVQFDLLASDQFYNNPNRPVTA